MKTDPKIRELRTLAGLSQSELAEKLFVSRELVSKWETGARRPDHRMLEQLAEIFSVPVYELEEKDNSILKELAECIPEKCGNGQPDEEKLLNNFLYTLSVRDRYVFIRRYYHFDDIKEIAAAAGMSPEYTRNVLMRIRKKLKKFLKEVC